MASISGATGRKRAFLIRYALRSFALVFLLAFLIRAFLFSSYSMSGSSMLPTIWPGDFLVAGKLGTGNPERGEIVVLRCPGFKERICLKRVVGVPGDRIEWLGGKLVLNGTPAEYTASGPNFQRETVNGRTWQIWPKAGPDEGPQMVPPGHVYLLNDRRGDRDDSRTWGTQSVSVIDAKAIRVWLSFEWFEGGKVRSWPSLRWDRLLRSID